MKTFIAAILLLLPGSGIAQTNQTVVPLGLENQNGNSNDGILEVQGHFQELFRGSVLATEWQSPVQITGVAFRVADGVPVSLSTVVPRVEIRFSTSSKTPEQMSPFYGDNKGADEKTVFLHDNVPLFGRALQPVNPFDLKFSFDQPFAYDPSSGSLLMYMQTTGAFTGRQIDAHGYSRLSDAPAAYVGSSGGFIDGVVVGYTPVIEFSWTAIPEPKSVLLFAAGALVIAQLYRRKSIATDCSDSRA